MKKITHKEARAMFPKAYDQCRDSARFIEPVDESIKFFLDDADQLIAINYGDEFLWDPKKEEWEEIT